MEIAMKPLPSRRPLLLLILTTALLTGGVARADAIEQRWSQDKAAAWYAKQPWLIGANYVPANAINQLEMWQPETFDPERIDRELGWAQALGMNTMRVFLHDLLWQQDSEGFRQRVDRFLQIAAAHGIRPMLVLFDSCWNPQPLLGPQPAPRPGVHNSGWVQSPSARALANPAEYARLQAYVTGIVGAFATDSRILAWDIWNEPTNVNDSIFPGVEAPGKVDLVLALLPKVFAWARAAGASQPLTSALWIPENDWSSLHRMKPIERIQVSQSDILSFHNYQAPSEFQRHLHSLMRYRRPIILSEYLARSFGNSIEGILPIAKRYNVGAINWGLVAGKSQTYFPWDSWQHPYVDRPLEIWHHDLLRADGSPYSVAEAKLMRDLAGRE
jgi:Cellulase (glycosyl hydrolase family 5)